MYVTKCCRISFKYACSIEALNHLQGTVLYSSVSSEGIRLEYPLNLQLPFFNNPFLVHEGGVCLSLYKGVGNGCGEARHGGFPCGNTSADGLLPHGEGEMRGSLPHEMGEKKECWRLNFLTVGEQTDSFF
jgi:hypothetical protein